MLLLFKGDDLTIQSDKITSACCLDTCMHVASNAEPTEMKVAYQPTQYLPTYCIQQVYYTKYFFRTERSF